MSTVIETGEQPSIRPERTPTGRRVLMCRPEHFTVVYRINPWMNPAEPTDTSLAHEQWQALYEVYLQLGYDVELIDPLEGLPDMVYAANGGFVIDGIAYGAKFTYPERSTRGDRDGDRVGRREREIGERGRCLEGDRRIIGPCSELPPHGHAHQEGRCSEGDGPTEPAHGCRVGGGDPVGHRAGGPSRRAFHHGRRVVDRRFDHGCLVGRLLAAQRLELRERLGSLRIAGHPAVGRALQSADPFVVVGHVHWASVVGRRGTGCASGCLTDVRRATGSRSATRVRAAGDARKRWIRGDRAGKVRTKPRT